MPPATLLCLLSDQRMQNVIPLFQHGMHFERVVLLASKEGDKISPRFKNIAIEMSLALKSYARWGLHEAPVDPMLPDDARLKCLDIIEKSGGAAAVTINFTGGTKPMSIGAYQAGLECGAPMLYVDTQAERIYRYTGGSPAIDDFNLKPIPVETLLQAHGREINQKATATKQLSPEELRLSEAIYAHRAGSLPQIVRLSAAGRVASKNIDGEWIVPVSAWSGCEWQLADLERSRMAKNLGETVLLASPAYQFLHGRWLEAYVYQALIKSGRFGDVRSQLRLTGLDNELDAACTINGKLGVVECKTGSLASKEGQSTLNRLRALRDSLGGLFAKPFLVMTQPPESLSAQFVQRASEYRACLVGIGDLGTIDQVIFDEMCKKRR